MIRSAAGWSCVVGLAVAAACNSSESESSEEAAQEQWRETMVRSPSPESGCFEATYPSTTWQRTECGPAPTKLYRPPSGAIQPQTAGNGNDYAAKSTGTISQTVGTFPKATGVAGETGAGGANVYSIQLNSNDMSGSKACGKIAGCQSWQQFVYAAGEKLLFVQSWLLNYGKCPATGGWMADGNNCYANSTTAVVPQIPISQLGQLKMSGTAKAGGNDSAVFTNGTTAYQASAADTTTYLSAGWNASEFNVIGDGNSSAATFKPGASITVNVAITGGTPSCQANAGTTGETNNLTLGACSVSGGSIQFTESLAGSCPVKKGDGGKGGGTQNPSGDGGMDDGDDMDGDLMSCGDMDGGDASDGDDGGDGDAADADDGGDGGEGGDAAEEAGDGGEGGGAGEGGEGGGAGEGGTTCDNSEQNAPTP
jgi:hypothetical protein